MRKKRWLAALCALIAALLLAVPAMADGSGTSGTTAQSEELDDINLDDLQLLFAKLQLEQAQLCKDSANSIIEQIEELQEEMNLTADTLERLRRLKTEGATKLPDDILLFMRDRGLAYYEPVDAVYWDYNIESVMTYQDDLNNKTQSMMVYLQDFISQYNSYLMGASDAVNSASETLVALAAAKSGSLFSTDGGTAAAGQYALVACAALFGGAGGTALMWAILDRKKTAKTPEEGADA